MTNKKKYGQFYTTNSKYIIGNLIDYIDPTKKIIEPFAGNKDLLFFTEKNVEMYDIDPKTDDVLKKDTLLDPPSYEGKVVVTNPPYLSRNKSKDKIIYDIYSVNDLYKAFIKTILKSYQGILVIPLNFFSDNDNKIRDLFFSHFTIKKVNVFEEQVFSDTTYTICSFFYEKTNKHNVSMDISFTFYPSNDTKIFTLKKEYGWVVGGDFINTIKGQNKNKISRLLKGQTPNSKLFLRAIDTGSDDGKINLSVNDEYFFGKNSDRSFATIVLDKPYTIEQQMFICEKFNDLLNENREKYKSLFLTNFRNSTKSYSRKRISFDMAYDLIQYILNVYL